LRIPSDRTVVNCLSSLRRVRCTLTRLNSEVLYDQIEKPKLRRLIYLDGSVIGRTAQTFDRSRCLLAAADGTGDRTSA
jgi:hypothetical protein